MAIVSQFSACKRRSVVLVLWFLSCGSCPVVLVLWFLFCCSCPVVLVLLFLFCYSYPVVLVLWFFFSFSFSFLSCSSPLSHGMVVPLRLLGPLVRATSVNACRALANHQQARRSTKLGAPSLAAVAAISAKSSSTNSGTSARFGSGGSGPSGQANDALSLVPWSCPYEARALAIAKLALYKARPSSLHATSSSSAASTTATTPTAGAAGAASPNSFFSSTHSTQVLAAHLQATLAPQDPRAAAAAAEAAAQAEMERQSSADALFPAGKEHAKRAISLAGGSSIYSKASGMQAVHRV